MKKSIKRREIKTVTYFDETSCCDEKIKIFVFYKIYKIYKISKERNEKLSCQNNTDKLAGI